MAQHYVTNATEVVEAYNTAADGDTILLAPGSYDKILLSGRSFSSGITIQSADPNNKAILTDHLKLTSTSNVTIQDIDVKPISLGSSARDNWVTVSNSDNVTISNMNITGYIPSASEGLDPNDPAATRLSVIAGTPYACGIYITNSNGTKLKNVEVSDVRVAITIGDSNNSIFDNIFVHDDREGINLYDVNGLKIQNSTFYNLTPWLPLAGGGDHGDFIQYWGVNTTDGIHHLTIDNNSFIQPPGAGQTQTIFGYLDGTTASPKATYFTITNNVIVGNHVHAIVVEDVKYGEVAGNVIVSNDLSVDTPVKLYTPSITINESRYINVHDNTLLEINPGMLVRMDKISLSNGTNTVHDNTVLSTDPTSPLYWHYWTQAILAGTPLPDDNGVIVSPPAALIGPEGMNAADLMRFFDPAANVQYGTDDADQMQGDSSDSFLFGMDGSDTLVEKAGNDILSGGEGRDRFVVNLGIGGSQSRDLILDLDFSTGEVLTVISAPGSFTDDADPNNDLRLLSTGKIAWIDSVADLRELIAAGDMTAAVAADGEGLELVFADAPGRVIEIASLSINDLLLG